MGVFLIFQRCHRGGLGTTILCTIKSRSLGYPPIPEGGYYIYIHIICVLHLQVHVLAFLCTHQPLHLLIHQHIDTQIQNDIHRYKSDQKCIHRQKDRYRNIFRTHHRTLPCNTIQRSTAQYNTIQDRQYATPRYFTTQHIRTNTQYIMLISFPALPLDYLHCIASNYILLHYIALQYISLHYNPLRYTTLHCNDVIPRVLTGTHTYRYIHRNMDVYINTLILAQMHMHTCMANILTRTHTPKIPRFIDA